MLNGLIIFFACPVDIASVPTFGYPAFGLSIGADTRSATCLGNLTLGFGAVLL